LEKLILKLTRCIKIGTPSERKIAKHLIEHLAELPFETVITLASKLKLSPMTIGRFVRSLGYNQFSDIREDLREAENPVSTPISLLSATIEQANNPLSALLVQQIQAIQSIYDLSNQPVWQAALEFITVSQDVFIASSSDTLELSRCFHSRLLEHRRNVHHIQENGSAYVALFDCNPEKTLLILMDCGGNLASLMRLAKAARKSGYKTLLITARYYEWGPDSADICLTLPLPQDGGQRHNLQLVSIIEFLLHSVTTIRGAQTGDRTRRMTELQRSLQA
jgi:DNA-binding MurR/RpiR family transcriptional regulator